MKLTKKFTAVLLSVLMMLSVPVTASAAEYDISITTAQGIDYLYAEQSYTLTAEIKNASKSDAEAATEFVWSSPTVSSLQTSGNKSITENSDGTTYTVRQSARITMPAAGTKFDVTAKYGSSSKTISITSKQPITSFDFTSESTSHSYYNPTNNTIYVDRKQNKANYDRFFNLSVNNILPTSNDDLFDVSKISINANKKFEIWENGTNSFKIFAPHDINAGKYQLTIFTSSGSTSKNCNVQVCVPEENDYKLNAKSSGTNIAETGSITLVQGKPDTINTVFQSSGVNDDMSFTLVNENGSATPAEYCTTDGLSCTLNIADQGTYKLHCKNISKDNGKLDRSILEEKVITVNVLRAKPINSITLYRLDEEGNRTSLPLTEATLYSGSSDESKRTLSLDNSIVCDPTIDNTTGDSIYFESENTKVATVDKNGKVEAKGKGTTTIWVRSTDNEKAYATLTVNVKKGTTSLTIKKEDGNFDIPAGHTEKMVATRNTDADDELYWYSDNAEVLSINSKTGEITAKKASDTPVVISARADSGFERTTTLNVVPAVRAESLTLTAKAYNNDRTESTTTTLSGKVYKDFFAKKNKYFIIDADAKSSKGECNDVLVWSISYNDGVGLTLDEAAEEGFITYKKNTDSQYEITPLKLGKYSVSCVATLNASNIQSGDATDSITIETVKPANSITVKNADTDQNFAGTTYLGIGDSVSVTVKTSTTDNDKKIDPPTYTVTSGEEYISVSQKTSADGEGITYTIKGLKYSDTYTRIIFSSRSGEAKSGTYTIYVRNNLNGNNVEVKGVPSIAVYTGSRITFDDLKVFVNGSSIDSSQYSVSYSDNTNVGTAKITITGRNDYNGSVKIVSFKITPTDITNKTTISSISEQYLTRETRKVEPSPYVTYDNRWGLSKDRDYTLSYKNNTKAGTATLTVTGIGNYKGTVSTTFKVSDIADYFTVSAIPVQTYNNGKEIKPIPTIKYKGTVLKANRDFELSYSYNTNTGIAYVNIKGIGNYYGTISKDFTIKPKKAKLKKVKKGKKSFTATWKQLSDVSGYQIMYARDKKFKKSKKSAWTDSYSTSTVVSKLKKKKTYYVRIRGYKNVNGKYIYGSWSKVKKIKVK